MQEGIYSQASSGAGSIKVEFSPPITGVTSIKYNGGGYSVGSTYNIKINGTDVFTNLSTISGWSQASHTISSTDISSFEIYTANDGWSLYNLLFNDASPYGTASFVPTAGVNGFHLDFADNSSDAALGATNDYATTVGAVTTSYPDFYAAGLYPPNNLFDGIATSSAIVYGGYSNADGNSGNSDIIWTPNGAYSVSSTLRVFAGYYSNISVNGVSLATGASQTPETWVTLAHTGPITSIKFENLVDDYAVRAAAIEIDGTILTTTTWKVNNLSVSSGYINNSVLTGSIYSGAGGVDKMFDGTTAACGPTVGAYVTFTPSTPIPINSSLRIRANVSNTSVDADFAINGSAVSTVSTGFPGDGFIGNTASTWTTISSPPSLLTSLRFGWAGSWMALSGIEIDGVVLTDIPAADDDSLVDVPANYGDDTGAGNEVRGNYCIWNPLNATGATLTNGNLEATLTGAGSGNESVRGTLAPSSGKWYWEETYTATSNTAGSYGVVSASTGSNIRLDAISGTNAVIYMAWNGSKAVNGTASTYGALTVNDVIGVALDLDGGTITFYKNGSSQGSISLPATGIAYTPTFAFEAAWETLHSNKLRPTPLRLSRTKWLQVSL